MARLRGIYGYMIGVRKPCFRIDRDQRYARVVPKHPACHREVFLPAPASLQDDQNIRAYSRDRAWGRPERSLPRSFSCSVEAGSIERCAGVSWLR